MSPPTEARSTETAPIEPAPTEPAPTEIAPAETAPTEPAPTEPAPTETTPTETAPTETAPTETAPTETAPTETAPTETAPTETAPTGASRRPAAIVNAPLAIVTSTPFGAETRVAELRRNTPIAQIRERRATEHSGSYRILVEGDAPIEGWIDSRAVTEFVDPATFELRVGRGGRVLDPFAMMRDGVAASHLEPVIANLINLVNTELLDAAPTTSHLGASTFFEALVATHDRRKAALATASTFRAQKPSPPNHTFYWVQRDPSGAVDPGHARDRLWHMWFATYLRLSGVDGDKIRLAGRFHEWKSSPRGLDADARSDLRFNDSGIEFAEWLLSAGDTTFAAARAEVVAEMSRIIAANGEVLPLDHIAVLARALASPEVIAKIERRAYRTWADVAGKYSARAEAADR